ncbi:flagellar motor protein MotB [Sphingobium subterraneum]|uniref:Flagellar motor protein MotB n=1 Tax=Sphingobium subterraneum TaxID=627688 RepID=A0A841J2Q1_9SPHN|nr:flagellar motor protein MotB [Sphingobium subterraneum]MBB6123806.1 flagellar motor protein MotB [Sphingobium subterraneum]
MKAIALTRRNRWAISFADLALLLLGFFVLLHANAGRQQEIVGQIAREFGAPTAGSDVLRADALFAPGEAMIGPQGNGEIVKVAQKMRGSSDIVEIHSVGQGGTTLRFDSWDLSAARLGSVARALTHAGIEPRRIVIRGLDQSQASAAKGQTFTFRYRPAH